MKEASLAAELADELYGVYYYRTGCGREYVRDLGWLTFFGSIAQKIHERIAPVSVLDAGCAMGFLVEALRDLGIEAYGIDVSEYAIGQVRPDMQAYCRVGSVTEALECRYDLITCIEVLEHLPKLEAELAIEKLCAATDCVLFSSTPKDFNEATHFNVQPPEYWAERFALHGFYRDLSFDGSFVTEWCTLFRKRKLPHNRLVQDYERLLWHITQVSNGLRATAVDQRSRLEFAEQRIRDHEAWAKDHAHMREDYDR